MNKFLLIAASGLGGIVFAQAPPQAKIVVKLQPIETVSAKPGQTVAVTVIGIIDPGFHVNSDKPADQYLIPLKLTWTEGALEKPSIVYPKPETAKLPFSEKPVSIYSNEFSIKTQFKVPSRATAGTASISGKLRFQACNDHECLIPRTLDITVPVEIGK